MLPSSAARGRRTHGNARIAGRALYFGIPGRLEPDLSGRRPVRSTPVLPVAARALLAGARGRGHRLSTGSKSLGAGSGSILFWAGISNRHILRKPTSGKSRWTRGPCLIWMTTASKASPCCPPRSTWRWPWLPRVRSSRNTSFVGAEGYRISPGAFLARGRNPHDSGDPFSRRGWRRHPFTSTVARRAWSNPVNHGCCMRPGRSVRSATAASRQFSGKRCSRRSRRDARRRSPVRTITRDCAKAASTMVLFSRASRSCGDTTERCWVKCRFPMGRMQSSMPINFTRRSSMPACRLSGLL